MAMVAGQRQNGPQASFVKVIEKGDEVVGFIAGVLNRVYNIGEKLCASDVFLVNEGKSLKDTLQLIDLYIEWARSNPKVIEVGLSWSDALPNARDIASIYRRKGAHLVGEQYEIRLDVGAERAAA
jgi:thiamine kinase-like enzyme